MSDDNVAFLGQKTVSAEEAKHLRVLGRLLARAGAILHTSMGTGANLAVIEGFRGEGKQPTLHTTGLHRTSPWVLLYGDETFIDTVCARWPDDEAGSRRHWDYLKDVPSLVDLNKRIHLALERRAAAPA